MNKNSITLSYYNYIIKDYPNKDSIVTDDINLDEDYGALMAWKFDFNRCSDEQIESLKENSRTFILDNYNKNSVGYKTTFPSEKEMNVYIFFEDSSHLKASLDRPRFLDLRAVVKERYQLYIERCDIKVDSIYFEEPQMFSGSFTRRLAFYIINFFVIYFMVSSDDRPFKYVVAATWFILIVVIEKLFNRRYKLVTKKK